MGLHIGMAGANLGGGLPILAHGGFMTIDKKTLDGMCRLARLAIDDDQHKSFIADVQGILTWVAALEAVDTKNTAPLASPVSHALPLRADKVAAGAGGDVEAVLGNAPERVANFYVVPKVVE